MKTMLYSERTAYAKMGRWRPFHLIITNVYDQLWRVRLIRTPLSLTWRFYRRTWPE